MKALTIWQPWASLIERGWKRYEFRSHNEVPRAVQNTRIAIHAGARKVHKGEIWDILRRIDDQESSIDPAAREWLEKMLSNPTLILRSHVLCTAVVGKPVSARVIAEQNGWINDSNRHHTFNYAWPLSDVEPVTPPVPARGFQKFWNWDGVQL